MDANVDPADSNYAANDKVKRLDFAAAAQKHCGAKSAGGVAAGKATGLWCPQPVRPIGLQLRADRA